MFSFFYILFSSYKASLLILINLEVPLEAGEGILLLSW